MFFLSSFAHLNRRLTWSKVHIILVVTALQGVQGAGDLAGKLLSTIHTLPLQMVAQVSNVIFIPAKAVERNWLHIMVTCLNYSKCQSG